MLPLLITASFLVIFVDAQETPPFGESDSEDARVYINNKTRLWPGGRIPFTISQDFDDDDRSIIANSMQHIEKLSCVTFTEKEGSDKDYVSIESRKDLGCLSYPLGLVVGTGAHTCNLERPGCMTFGTVVHKLLHGCGAAHEHNRPDRDKYVTINWENILPDKRSQMFRVAGGPGSTLDQCPKFPNISSNGTYDHCVSYNETYTTYGLPYDYESIMHYDIKVMGFSKNPNIDVITPRDRKVTRLGNKSGMTPLDVAKLLTAYACPPLSECVRNQNGMGGTLDVTGKPDRTICEWALLAPPGHLVQIKFEKFTFADCQDYVDVVDDAASIHMGRFCNTTTGFVYISQNDTLRVIARRTKQANGFKASWLAYKHKV